MAKHPLQHLGTEWHLGPLVQTRGKSIWLVFLSCSKDDDISFLTDHFLRRGKSTSRDVKHISSSHRLKAWMQYDHTQKTLRITVSLYHNICQHVFVQFSSAYPNKTNISLKLLVSICDVQLPQGVLNTLI